MRIAIMARALAEKGGIGVYTRNLVEALLDLDPSNEYLLFIPRGAPRGRFGERTNLREVVIDAPGKALWDQLAVPRACRRERVDVLLHPKFTVPLFTSVPSVMVVHGADWFLPDAAEFYRPVDRAYIRAVMPLYLRRARAVISVSQLTTDDFVRLFPSLRGRIHTVYFGPAANFRRVEDPATIAEVRERYRLPERYILTLTKVGGAGRKNLRGVLDAYARVHGTIDCGLVIGGAGCERFRGDFGIPSEDWGRDVLFPGWIEQRDLPAVYSGSELFLYPSNREAFPIPITEAMACGTPIVTSRVNGLLEIAGAAALFVDPDDADAIAAAIEQVLDDAALRARLAAAGHERARMFSWASCARRTLAILESVAADARTTGRAARHRSVSGG